MNIDFVFPKNNESEFIELALKLGYDALVFCYKDKPKRSISKKIDIKTASLDPKSKADFIISDDSKKLRHNIESSNIDIFFELEYQQSKDFIHQRGSGLNHVLCKLMNKKNRAYAFSFSQILSASDLQKSRILGRIRQNIALCKKFKVKTYYASFARSPLDMRSPHDLKVFFENI